MYDSQITEKTANRSLNLACIVITLLLLVKNVFAVDFPQVLFTAAAGLGLLLLKNEDRCVFFSFMLPLFVGLPSREIALIFVVIAIVQFHFVLDARAFIPIVLIVLADAIANLINGGDQIIYQAITYLIYLMIPLIFFTSKLDVATIQKCMLYFCLGALVGFSMVFIAAVKYTSLAIVFSGTIRFGKIYKYIGISHINEMLISYNANQLGIYSCTAIAFMLSLWNSGRLKNASLFIFVGLFIFFGYLTMSRAFLLGLAFIIIWFVLFSSKSKGFSGLWQKLVILALVAIALVLIVMYIPEEFSAKLLSRIDANSVDDMSNGRIDIGNEEISYLLSHPLSLLFGAGTSGYLVILQNTASHNMLLDILICWGLMGGCIFAGWLLYLQRFYYAKFSSISIFYFLPLFVLALVLQTGQFTTYPVYIMIFGLALLSVNVGIKDENLLW